MSQLREIIELGKELGYVGEQLQQFLDKEREANEREAEREAKEREAEREAREKEREFELLLAREKRQAEEAERQLIREREEAERESVRQRDAFARDERAAERELKKFELELKSKTSETPSIPVQSALMPKLPIFCERTDEIDAYLQRFELYATAAGWEEKLWGISIASLLQGKALSIYHQLSVEDAADYQKVKKALLLGFECTADGFRLKFRNSRLSKNESAKQFATRMVKMYDKWMEMAGGDKDMEGMRDVLLREQFLNACDQSLTVFLKEKRLKNLDEVVDHADLYIEAHRQIPRRTDRPENSSVRNVPIVGSQKVAGMYRNERRNDMSVNRSARIVCYICHKPGHRANECYSRSAIGKVDKPVVKSAAAAARTTTSMPKTQSEVQSQTTEKAASFVEVNPAELVNADGWLIKGDKGFRVVCGSAYAVRNDRLKTAEGMVEGQRVTVMRDGGCTTVLVKKALVPEDKFTGRTVNVMMANSKICCYPEARIHVKTPYFTGEVLAASLETPLFDLIVGDIEGSTDGVPEVKDEKVKPKRKGKPKKKKVVKTEKCVAVTRSQSDKRERVLPKLKVNELSKICLGEDIGKKQREDKSLEKIRQHERDGRVFVQRKTGEESSFVVKSGKLFRRVKVGGQQRDQLIVPREYRQAVLNLAHAGIMGGHLGISKTKDRILDKFYWPGISIEITRYCKSCDVCQRTVDKGRVTRVKMGKMPLVDEPFAKVAVDIIGPIEPRSSNGSKYILTVVDYATRYPEARALRNIDTVSVAEAMIEMFSTTGIPREIVSDRGSQFTSQMMEEIYRLLSVKATRTTPYHAQSNGLVERFNGTLKRMIKKMCVEQPKEWHRFIAPLLFAYRDVPQKSTGFSPFELVFGHSVRGPLTLLNELWEGKVQDVDAQTSYEYVISLRERLQDTLRLATEELKQSQEVAKQYYDRKAKDRKLQVDDLVLLLLPNEHNKLFLQWKGPYKVTKRCNRWNYEIDVNGVVRKYHINMLKKYVKRENEVDAVEVASAVMEEEDQETDKDHLTVPTFVQSEDWHNVTVNKDLTKKQKKEIKEMLELHADVLTDVPGRTNVDVCTIKLVTPEEIRVRPYPIPYNLRDKVKEEIRKMKEMGVIEPSSSAFSSPMCVAAKKDGSIRLCLDLRELNKHVEYDAEPMGDPEAIFTKLAHSKYFTKLDLTKGYWQIPLSDDSKKYTAFVTPDGLYQFTVLPFGLVNAPAIFNRVMRQVFHDLTNVETFLDDILVHSQTWEQHCELIKIVMERLREAGLVAKPSKCEVGMKSLTYLGHVVGGGMLRPTVEKVECIEKARIPKTKKEVRSFLGLAGYYRRYIPHYSTIATPLSDLTKKNASNVVEWGEKEQVAFDKIKAALVNEPILRLADVTKPFILQTDASNTGLGAVLMQEVDGQKWPVAYASKKLTETESRYAVIEKECLAMVWATKKFYQYLYGREFSLETDHQPLTYLQSTKQINGRLMRWSLHLQQFRFVVTYVKGSENVGADYLSRCE